MTTEQLVALLQELILARGPCGQEDEVRPICRRELERLTDEVFDDPAGNVIGLLKGRAGTDSAGGDASPIRVVTHMDEISMITKAVLPDGNLRVTNLGGLWPGNIGQGPVEILGDSGVLPGVLSFGPMHVSHPRPQAREIKHLDWEQVFILTRRTPEQLAALGVHAGTRVAIARCRRQLFTVGDCLGGYYMDNRAAITIALGAASLLGQAAERPPQNIYFAMTVNEEVNGGSAAFAARTLPGALTVALELGPIAEEYGTVLNDQPVIVYADSRGPYTKAVADRLLLLARELELKPQTAVWAGFGSDASIAAAGGQTAQSALISFPTENSHGFEVLCREVLSNCARLLARFLQAPADPGH